MFVYAHWLADGYQQIQAFNKPERAAQFACDQIAQYLSVEEKNYNSNRGMGLKELKELPIELKTLREKFDTIDRSSMKDALMLIELYQDYCRYVVGTVSPLHTIVDISVME
jgi:hypothetical protein